MSPEKQQHAPHLRQQVLQLLLGTAWFSLLCLGLLSGLWQYHQALSQAPVQLAVVGERAELAVQQLQARQRDRAALLAARSDLRQTLQAWQQQPEPALQRRLGELLGDAIGTIPSYRHAVIVNGDSQIIAASDPALLGQLVDTPLPPPDELTLVSRYRPDNDGRFRHYLNLIWAGQRLGTLRLEESAAELRALFERQPDGELSIRLRLLDSATGAVLAGAPPATDAELQQNRRIVGSSWTLQAGMSRADVLQPFYQWLGALVMLALILTSLLLLLGGRIAERFSRPLAMLATYASQWRVGTPWRARLPKGSSGELQQLADGLAVMAQRENHGLKALTEALLETQQVESQFRHLFENSPVACLLAGADGRIQLINPACASLFGYRVEELHGQSVELLMPESARAEHHARMASFFAAPRERLLGVSRDLFGVRRDGSELQIEIGVTPIRLGGEALALATINDLSTRKAYEQALLAMSRTDGLTGLANRRHFDQVLADEWRRLRRGKQGAAILMIDIDHFKLLNDRHGHLVGDEILRMVGKALKQQLHRPGDFIARYGGEEFVVLLPDTDRDGAMVLAEQMRQAVEALPPAGENGDRRAEDDSSHLDIERTPISISVGVGSCLDCNLVEPAELLATADRHLYGAKRAGRNRVMG